MKYSSLFSLFWFIHYLDKCDQVQHKYDFENIKFFSDCQLILFLFIIVLILKKERYLPKIHLYFFRHLLNNSIIFGIKIVTIK